MTEDTSPENLRKFLEGDDPALVMMGLSIAKGTDVPEELLPTVLRLYMWDDDKTVRATAKSVFNKYAPIELKEKVKKNWKASYRTLSIDSVTKSRPYFYKFPKAINPFLEAFKSQDDFAEIALEPLIKALGDDDWQVRKSAADVLGGIGERAVEPLIKALGDEHYYVRRSAIQALERIGNPRAVKPLIKALEKDENHYVRQAAAKALGKIDGKRAVEPLIKALRGNSSAAEALGDIGDERAVKPLIKAFGGPLGRGDDYYVRIAAAKALGKIGDKRAVEPLTIIRSGYEGRSEVRRAIKNALKKLGHEV